MVDIWVYTVLIFCVLLLYTKREMKRWVFINGWLMHLLAVCNVLSLSAITSLAALYGSYILDNYPVWMILLSFSILAVPAHIYEYKLYRLKAPSFYTKNFKERFRLEDLVGYLMVISLMAVYYYKTKG